VRESKDKALHEQGMPLSEQDDSDHQKLGMCGMDFSSSVWFQFGFEKNCGFG